MIKKIGAAVVPIHNCQLSAVNLTIGVLQSVTG